MYFQNYIHVYVGFGHISALNKKKGCTKNLIFNIFENLSTTDRLGSLYKVTIEYVILK